MLALWIFSDTIKYSSLNIKIMLLFQNSIVTCMLCECHVPFLKSKETLQQFELRKSSVYRNERCLTCTPCKLRNYVLKNRRITRTGVKPAPLVFRFLIIIYFTQSSHKMAWYMLLELILHEYNRGTRQGTA